MDLLCNLLEWFNQDNDMYGPVCGLLLQFAQRPQSADTLIEIGAVEFLTYAFPPSPWSLAVVPWCARAGGVLAEYSHPSLLITFFEGYAVRVRGTPRHRGRSPAFCTTVPTDPPLASPAPGPRYLIADNDDATWVSTAKQTLELLLMLPRAQARSMAVRTPDTPTRTYTPDTPTPTQQYIDEEMLLLDGEVRAWVLAAAVSYRGVAIAID